MIEIPQLEVVRSKTEPIADGLLYPDPYGHYFPQGLGTRVVYLDSRYDYPDPIRHDAPSERSRQYSIWRQVMETKGATTFLEKDIEDNLGLDKVDVVRDRVAEEIGSRNTAEFFERVFSELLAKSLEVVVIATGITYSSRETYHDIGCLRAQ